MGTKLSRNRRLYLKPREFHSGEFALRLFRKFTILLFVKTNAGESVMSRWEENSVGDPAETEQNRES
jgi:hypothetical protein